MRRKSSFLPRILLFFPVLSYLFLAAHELRVGSYGLLAGWVLMAVLVLVWRRLWVRSIGLGTLVLGLFRWTDVTVGLLRFRLALDAPYGLLLIIMGGVAALMAASIALLLSNTMREWFACRR